jgi:hypothetical protein
MVTPAPLPVPFTRRASGGAVTGHRMTPPRSPTPPRRRIASAALGALALLALAPAQAEVFKCAGRDGIPVYQDTPCPAGKELRNFQTDPPAITVLPAPEISGDARAPAEPRRATRDAAAPKGNASAADAKARGDAAERKFVRPGMTEGEVVAKLGLPEVTSRGARASGARWTYLPAARDPDTITIITFANGVVADVERKVSK